MELSNKKLNRRELHKELQDAFYKFALDTLGYDSEESARNCLEPQFETSRIENDGRRGLFFEIIADIADDKCKALDDALTAVVQKYDEDAFFVTDGEAHNAYVFEDKDEGIDECDTSDFRPDAEPKKERPLNEGPGAGYTVECKGYHFDSVQHEPAKVTDFGDLAKKYEFQCNVLGHIDHIEASSYYYMGTIEEDDDQSYRNFLIDEVMCIVPNNWGIDSEEEIFSDALDELEREGSELIYGGGWSHSTWDGTILELGDIRKFFMPEEYGANSYSGRLTDEWAINFIDTAV